MLKKISPFSPPFTSHKNFKIVSTFKKTKIYGNTLKPLVSSMINLNKKISTYFMLLYETLYHRALLINWSYNSQNYNFVINKKKWNVWLNKAVIALLFVVSFIIKQVSRNITIPRKLDKNNWFRYNLSYPPYFPTSILFSQLGHN